MTIYNRLFRRTPSVLKETKEDFLTEALGDLLTRMPISQQIDFIKSVLLNDIDVEWIHKFLENVQTNTIFWATQYRISSNINGSIVSVSEFDRKRPDMVLFANGRPVLVVEAKVDAEATETQIAWYGDWLEHPKTGPNTPTAVVLLLKKRSRAPNLTKISSEGARNTKQVISVATWRGVYDWLIKFQTLELSELRDWGPLSLELAKFLLEIEVVDRQIESSPANFDQIQAAQRFFSLRGHLTSVIQAVEEGTSDFRAGKVSNQVPSKTTLDERRNLIWSWVWITAPTSTPLYAGWGFYFPTPNDPWSKLQGCSCGSSYFFLCIESDVDLKNRFRSLSQVPDGWSVLGDKTLVKLLSLTEDTFRDSDLSQVATQWVNAGLNEIWDTAQRLADK